MGFVEDFFSTLQSYNEIVVPVAAFTFVLGVVAVFLASSKPKHSGQMISLILSFLWMWSGVVFFILFYGPQEVVFLNVTMPGVWYLSGFLWIIQSLVFLFAGVFRSSLSFKLGSDRQSVIGTVMIIYAMIIYPLIGLLTGRSYPEYPIFGVAPCPVTIFTFGLLQWTDRKVPVFVAIIPLVWALLGVMPVLALDVWADVGLILSGIIGFTLILVHNRKLGS